MQIDEFKRFVLRGNVIDLGVGVVIGIAFKSVVDSLVADMLTPLIAMIGMFSPALRSSLIKRSPFSSGMTRSVITRSIACRLTISAAASPLVANSSS